MAGVHGERWTANTCAGCSPASSRTRISRAMSSRTGGGSRAGLIVRSALLVRGARLRQAGPAAAAAAGRAGAGQGPHRRPAGTPAAAQLHLPDGHAGRHRARRGSRPSRSGRPRAARRRRQGRHRSTRASSRDLAKPVQKVEGADLTAATSGSRIDISLPLPADADALPRPLRRRPATRRRRHATTGTDGTRAGHRGDDARSGGPQPLAGYLRRPHLRQERRPVGPLERRPRWCPRRRRRRPRGSRSPPAATASWSSGRRSRGPWPGTTSTAAAPRSAPAASRSTPPAPRRRAGSTTRPASARATSTRDGARPGDAGGRERDRQRARGALRRPLRAAAADRAGGPGRDRPRAPGLARRARRRTSPATSSTAACGEAGKFERVTAAAGRCPPSTSTPPSAAGQTYIYRVTAVDQTGNESGARQRGPGQRVAMTRFYKVSGSGNDFLALAEPSRDPGPETIRAWCRRGVSLGGGRPVRPAAGAAAARRMDYFNADGLPADLCLNGTRCAAQLAFHLGWAARDGRDADGRRRRPGPAAGRRRAWRVDLPVPARSRAALTIEAAGAPCDRLPHPGRGAPLRAALARGAGDRRRSASWDGRSATIPSSAPPGTNVNFVRFPDTAPDGNPDLRARGGGRDPLLRHRRAGELRRGARHRARPGCRSASSPRGASSWRSTGIPPAGRWSLGRRRPRGRRGGAARRGPGEPRRRHGLGSASSRRRVLASPPVRPQWEG